MKCKQAVVTGAYGFLGRNVAKIFSENGYSVTGLGHGTWHRLEWQHWGLSEWHPCNISMDSLNTYVQQPDVVIHCAGSGSVGYSLTHPMQDFERTVSTTLTVLEFLRLNSPKTVFIYPSSAAVYGNADTLPITESSRLDPISPYGVHKKIAEDLIRSYAEHFSIPVAIVRLFSLYGPGLRKQLLWDACTKIQRGDIDFFGTGQEIRDWLNVTDTARLFLTLSVCARPDSAIIVNGGTGKGTSVRDIISLLLEDMEIDEEPHFSSIPKLGDPEGYIADIGKVTGCGWKPEISIKKGIEEYVHWYRSGAP